MCCDTIIAPTLEHITEPEPSALDSSAIRQVESRANYVPTSLLQLLSSVHLRSKQTQHSNG